MRISSSPTTIYQALKNSSFADHVRDVDARQLAVVRCRNERGISRSGVIISLGSWFRC